MDDSKRQGRGRRKCNCGTTLKGKRSNAKYCSKECRQKAYRERKKHRSKSKRICPVCKTAFKPRNTHHRYDLPRCRRKAQRARRVRLIAALCKLWSLSEIQATDLVERDGMKQAEQLIPERYRMEVLYGIA